MTDSKSTTSRKGVAIGLLIGGLTLAVIIVLTVVLSLGKRAAIGASFEPNPIQKNPKHSSLSDSSRPNHVLFPVKINRPNSGPRVDTDIFDNDGQPVTVSCQTCHATRAANFENRIPTDLNEFHNGLEFSHSSVSCLSCHNSDNYDFLKLADQTRLEFVDVMTLCSQCHGTQRRDYDHGAHGGMNGYWDLTKGPRTRNNCVDCHDPHVPAFPKMRPTFKPHDRFLSPTEPKAETHAK